MVKGLHQTFIRPNSQSMGKELIIGAFSDLLSDDLKTWVFYWGCCLIVGQMGMGYNKENTPYTCCVEYEPQTRVEAHLYIHQKNGSRWAIAK